MGANNSRLPGHVYSYIRTVRGVLTPGHIYSYNRTLKKPTPGHVYSYNTTGYKKSNVLTVASNIDNQEIRRLWSYNSGSGTGKYVFITDNGPGKVLCYDYSKSYFVKATGDAEGTTLALTDITFLEIQRRPDPQLFQLQFNKNNQDYYLTASERDVVAVDGANDATSFEVKQLFQPNSAFCVLQSNKKQGTDDLYLSSDGAGNMKLKVWNKPIPPPPDTTAEVDPALLFRVVRPYGMT
ncbi:uncharacterized protein LOC114521312 isoform X4 [Dendronephthya gigantea]|nr:uncharacterized protein LOC114521312 isoform X3 [Dendronephthya gigantea]XP_028397508.1 uncharacterized protein LOC114521312 isoform X3 [Dendronephthya gigantea]XP_028397509.1 uncharacterized protein LOC114521312 isoform X4 [Dendronephthya gigantea]